MVDQDMQAALGVTLYQGRWALILDSVGELGCRESCLTVRVGEMGHTTYFPYVLCVCHKGEPIPLLQ